ncbi:MAG TPA: thioredoxin family protein [Chitinophagales bacterium]|nr:thioredoxin family protein [Chitinophagales bacterium]
MNLGDSLIPFHLKGTDSKMHSSDELESINASVIIFSCNHCPYVRAYITRLRDIIQQYQNRSVGFFLINSNDAKHYPADSYQNMIPMAEHIGIGGNYLHDETQEIATAYGAQRTPEVFLFGKNKRLVYHGAIDDNWEKPDEVSINYLAAALDAVLNNQEVLVNETQARGCTIKWKKSVSRQ